MIPLVMSVIAKTETFQRDMAKAGKSVKTFSTTTSRTTATVAKLSRSFLALAGVGGGLYMFGNMIRSGVREAAAFEKQMSNVSTMLDEQSMSMLPRYTEQLRSMSREFGEGTETLSKGLYDILSASIDTSKAIDVLTVSTKAAKAGMTDTGVAADAITTILNSYSLDAERAGDVSDKLFTIVKRGKTTFGELAPNIGKIAALAATAGESFDDLGATLATMTRAGVQTEIAITSLRAIILSFLKPQSDSIALARKYGVELNSATLRTIGLTGVIQKLKNATAEELAVIVPTSRAITGFAAAIQKSEALAGDYELMLDSLGATEEAYQKIADDSAFQLEKSKQQWVDIKRTVGNAILPSLAAGLDSLSESLDKNRGSVKRWGEDTAEGFGMAKAAMDAYWESWMMWVPRTIKGFVMPSTEEVGKAKAGGSEWPSIDQMVIMGDKAGTEIKAPPGTGGARDAVVDNAEANKKILADTREKLSSIRAMHDKTRMEKIQMLENYRMAHFGHTKEIEAAEQLLEDEITSIKQSRVDAMEVYNAELREDMESSALYTSEKFADAAQSIEGSMSSAFQSMIQGGANFKDAMNAFFIDIGNAFAKMAADMAARAAMNAIIGAAIGGLAGAGSQGAAGGSGGNPASGSPTMGDFSSTLHSGWVPHGTPSFRRGRGLKSNEMAAIIEKDEMLVPNKQIAKGVSGSSNFEPNFNIIIVRDEKAAQIEAMNSKEGEKSYIRHASRNRNI